MKNERGNEREKEKRKASDLETHKLCGELNYLFIYSGVSFGAFYFIFGTSSYGMF